MVTNLRAHILIPGYLAKRLLSMEDGNVTNIDSQSASAEICIYLLNKNSDCTKDMYDSISIKVIIGVSQDQDFALNKYGYANKLLLSFFFS